MFEEEVAVDQPEEIEELGLADWVEQTLLIMEYPARPVSYTHLRAHET